MPRPASSTSPHMGQVLLVGDGAAAAMETLVPVDVIGLGEFKRRYAFFTNIRAASWTT